MLLPRQKGKLPRHDLAWGCFRAETSLRRRTADKAIGGQHGVWIACHVERSETSLDFGLPYRRRNDQRFFSRDCGIRMTRAEQRG